MPFHMNDLSRSQLGYSGQEQQIRDINELQFNESNFKLLKSMLIVRLQQQDSENKLKLLDMTEKKASSQTNVSQNQQTSSQCQVLAESDSVKQLVELTNTQENYINQQLRNLISKYGFPQSMKENPIDCLDRSINHTVSQLNYYKMKCQELLLDYTELQYKEALSDVVSKMVDNMNYSKI